MRITNELRVALAGALPNGYGKITNGQRVIVQMKDGGCYDGVPQSIYTCGLQMPSPEGYKFINILDALEVVVEVEENVFKAFA